MKKTTWLILLLVLVVGVLIFVLNRQEEQKGTLAVPADYFQIKDTAAVTKIFVATQEGKTDTFRRTTGGWLLNGRHHVNPSQFDQLMEILVKMRVKAPVGMQSVDGVLKDLAVHHYKVEVYNDQGLQKTLFIGSATQDGLANYIHEPDLEIPYIVHIPGWNGNFGPRLKITPTTWRNTQMFRVSPPNVVRYSVEYPEEPTWSFNALVDEEGQISISPLQDSVGEIDSLNQTTAKEMLYNVNKVHYLYYLDTARQSLKRDIRTKYAPLATLTVEKKGGKQQKVQIVRKPGDESVSPEIRDNVVYAYTLGDEPTRYATLQRSRLLKILRRFDMFELAN